MKRVCQIIFVIISMFASQANAETYDYAVFRPGSPIDIKIKKIINNFGPYAGFSPVLVADLNHDGKAELVTVVTDYRDHGGSFIVIDGANPAKHNIVRFGEKYGTPGVSFGYACGPLAISEDGLLYAVTGTSEKKSITSYRYTGSDLTKEAEAPLEHNFYGNPRIADFDGDGRYEVFVGNEVFDGRTLAMIGSGGENNVGQHYQHDGAMFMMGCAADVLPEHSGVELVCGNQIFGVSRSGVVLLKTIGNKHEGSAQVADLNADGSPEVLVRTTMGRLSLYDVKSGREVFRDAYVMTGYPAIGDIDGDGTLEIVGLTSSSKMVAYKYDVANGRLRQFWEMTHSDRSAQTSMTLFDFNHDGKAEIVYRDEQTLRIIDGSTAKPVTVANMSVGSATKSEYPVVADFDGDGQAEIIVPGTMYKDYTKDNASINIFSANRWAWAPAPQFWRQY